MTRSDRLFQLIQVLRRLPAPVTAARLAQETGVSVRSIYRDVESLRMAGAEIGGERGYGYCLIDDGTLPPQRFNRIEIEALVLGLSEVRHMGDPALVKAANDVIGKVAASLPLKSQQDLIHTVSQVHHFEERYAPLPDMGIIREGCWREEALMIRYTDKGGAVTERIIWPLAIVYLDNMLVVLAWCCLRKAFRIFRAERITTVEAIGASFRPRRVALLRIYLAQLTKP
jgi:predicted DNA-binding transcriptional regulator YafY